MHTFRMRRLTCAALSLTLLLFASVASAQEFSLKPNESVDPYPVYWIKDCRSLLTSFAGVDVLDGPPGITL